MVEAKMRKLPSHSLSSPTNINAIAFKMEELEGNKPSWKNLQLHTKSIPQTGWEMVLHKVKIRAQPRTSLWDVWQ